MKCPDCGSENVDRYSNNGIDCNHCGHMGRAQDFGISEAEKSARVAALAQARCATCQGRGYIVKDHTVNGLYIVDCPACSISSTHEKSRGDGS